MSDEPKTTKVYLMVECEVENPEIFGPPEDRAIKVLDHMMFSKCVGVKGKGYKSEILGSMILQKPVALPGNIKAMLDHGSINEKGEILIRGHWEDGDYYE